MKSAYILFLVAITTLSSALSENAQGKVQNLELFRNVNSNIIVTFKESHQEVYSKVNSKTFADRGEQLKALKRNLQAATKRHHAKVIRNLKPFKVSEIKSFWISNQLLVRGANPRVVSYLSGLPSVKSIEEDEVISLEPIKTRTRRQAPAPPPTPTWVTWGIRRIRAPEVWNSNNGTQGEGVRIAFIDTGIRASHEALRTNFATVDGWRDGTERRSPTPEDNVGYGTFYAGVAAGNNGIGVAPRATIMACRACDVTPYGGSACTASAIMDCGQWILCPSMSNNCSTAPQVVSISWTFSPGSNYITDLIARWRAANIFAVFANGNVPICQTDGVPPSPYQGLRMTVGSTNERDQVTSREKNPTIVAPGENIYSAFSNADNGYQYLRGNAAAGPHLAGTAALLISQRRGAPIAEIEQIIIDSTFRSLNPSGSGRPCNVDESRYPNEIAGNGLLDAAAAYRRMRQ